ncbi:hypothetical protein GCM10010505_37090 [Kitasatospora aburaviensis]
MEPGPAVAPGVFTVTPTVLAYAVPGTAIARTAPTASAFTAAARRTKPLNIDNFPSGGNAATTEADVAGDSEDSEDRGRGALTS